MSVRTEETKRSKRKPQKKINMNQTITFQGIEFPSEQALHEFRLIFDFDYFSDLAEQNYPTI